ncbi:hypothetical protein CNYM01_11821 [Colletotrichum nymphaeae SA-01]|uniref:Uncharacterized protein n=1 Tax=Colletotrichum nymphaeae SA-01 TaxID=1460502 RepID=A0A135T4S1_9PEZI|nr:hypothetical protein CNYM01_11821 [Colletotrichum nymphaeae SA-01]
MDLSTIFRPRARVGTRPIPSGWVLKTPTGQVEVQNTSLQSEILSILRQLQKHKPRPPRQGAMSTAKPQPQPSQPFQTAPQVLDSIERAQSKFETLMRSFTGGESSAVRNAPGEQAPNAAEGRRQAETPGRVSAEAAKLRRRHERLELDFLLFQKRMENRQRQPAIDREWWKRESAARINLANELGQLREEHERVKAELEEARAVIKKLEEQVL